MGLGELDGLGRKKALDEMDGLGTTDNDILVKLFY